MKEKFFNFIKKHYKLLTAILSVIFGVVVLLSSFLLIFSLSQAKKPVSASAAVAYNPASTATCFYRPSYTSSYSSGDLDFPCSVLLYDPSGTFLRFYSASYVSFSSSGIMALTIDSAVESIYLPSYPVVIQLSSYGFAPTSLLFSNGFGALNNSASIDSSSVLSPISVSTTSSSVSASVNLTSSYVFPASAFADSVAFNFSSSNSEVFPFSNLTNYSLQAGETCYYLGFDSDTFDFYFSSFVAPASAVQLSQPDPYLLGNQIRWNTVPNAVSYDIYRDGSLVTNIDNDGSSVFTYTPTVAGSYTVIAKGNGTDYSDSDPSDPVIFTPALSSPSVSQVYNILYWDSVDNATSYEILKDGFSVGTVSDSVTVQYIMPSSGSYTVVSKASGYSDSSPSLAISYTVPDISFTGVWVLGDSLAPISEYGSLESYVTIPLAYSHNSNGSSASWHYTSTSFLSLFGGSSGSNPLMFYPGAGVGSGVVLLSNTEQNAQYISFQSEPSDIDEYVVLFWYQFNDIANKINSSPWSADLYDEGFSAGYENGYSDGYDSGASDGLTNPLSFFIVPIDSFLNTDLFGSISIGDIVTVVLFVMVALIFIKMFAGG